MDRLCRIVSHGSLALLLGTTVSSLGCRSMKSEIPPGKAYSTTGAPPAAPTVGFSSDPRPDASAAAGLYKPMQQASGPGGVSGDGVQQVSGNTAGPNGSPGQSKYGTPIGGNDTYTVPTGGKYGPPGTTALPASNSMPQAIPKPDPSSPENPTTTKGADMSSPGSDQPLKGALGVELP